MYAVTSMLLDSRTRATLRSAEFGFFGVTVRTCVHTPRFCGEPFTERRMRFLSVLNRQRSAGAFVFLRIGVRGLRTSWLIVGTPAPHFVSPTTSAARGLHRRQHERPNGSAVSLAVVPHPPPGSEDHRSS